MRSVIDPPQAVQVASPVSRIEPVTTRVGVARGGAFCVVCTASNSAGSMMGGTLIGICPAFGFIVRVFEQRR